MTRPQEEKDALLVGAAYGELTASEKEQLRLQLADDPSFQGELDHLSLARSLVARSGAMEPSADAPSAITAQLVAAAARRVAGTGEAGSGSGLGVWDRIRAALASCVQHPALASAAALVLVAGVWGVLQLRGGNDVAVAVAPPSEVAADSFGASGGAPREEAAVAAAAPTGGAGSVGSAEGAYPAQLADGSEKQGYADSKRAAKEREMADLGKRSERGSSNAVLKVSKPPAKSDRARIDGVEVRTDEPKLLALDDADKNQAVAQRKGEPDFAAKPEPRAYEAEEDAVANSDSASTAGATAGAAAATPGAASGAAPKLAAKPAPAAAPGSPKDSGGAKSAPPSESARTLHARLTQLVKANKCTQAAKVGSELFTRYPDYYAEFIANSRELAACRNYIQAEKKKAEQSRSRGKAAAE